MDDAGDAEFADGEVEALGDLRGTLRQIAEWPPDNPLSFVLMLAPRTRGKLGELLLDRYAVQAGLPTERAESVAYDRQVGRARCEVKFSTEDPPRFQQVRDPRLPNGTLKYDYLVCISARPHGLIYWLVPAQSLGELMDAGCVTVQHAMSDTKWFLPSRIESDPFSGMRHGYEDFLEALQLIA
ncbi:MAG: hypothetical protein H0U12_10500 [Thermoleophilaceae bacterium]|nr:hypothetical protein [Thermoleophilaceae bacterium]